MSASFVARFKNAMGFEEKRAKVSKASNTSSNPPSVDETHFKAILATYLILTGKIDIPKPTPADTLIVTSSDDNVIHSVPLSLLVQHSDFFAGLLTIPTPSVSSPNHSDPIVLPDLPSSGLKLVLGILSLFDNISTPANQAELALNWLHRLDIILPEASVVSDAARITDRYAITFPYQFGEALLIHPSTEPRLAFSLAAVAPNATPSSVRPHAINALGSGQGNLPFYLRQILAQFALVRLRHFDGFVYHRGKVVQDLRQSLRDAPLSDGHAAGYTLKCPKIKRPKGGKCCRANKQGLDWADMKRDAADAVCLAVFRNGADLGSGYIRYSFTGLQAIMVRAVPCKRCAARFAQIFAGPVAKFYIARIGDGEF